MQMHRSARIRKSAGHEDMLDVMGQNEQSKKQCAQIIARLRAGGCLVARVHKNGSPE